MWCGKVLKYHILQLEVVIMQVKDIIEKIDFHDSNVIELLHENNKVNLKVDLCMWRQKGYKKGDDELKEISFEFDSIENYIWDSDKIESEVDYDTILDVSYRNGILKFVLVDDRVSIITFKCNTVKIVI